MMNCIQWLLCTSFEMLVILCNSYETGVTRLAADYFSVVCANQLRSTHFVAHIFLFQTIKIEPIQNISQSLKKYTH